MNHTIMIHEVGSHAILNELTAESTNDDPDDHPAPKKQDQLLTHLVL